MALMTIKEYCNSRFTRASCPSARTVKRWIAQGKLHGQKIGGQYYIDPDIDVLYVANELVVKVLKHGAQKT